MLNFIFETEPIIEVQNKKILLFDFIVFFLFLFMRHEPGIWWKCGDHDAGKKQRQSAQLQISRQAIQSSYPVLHPLNQKTHVPVKQSSSASLLQAIIQKD